MITIHHTREEDSVILGTANIKIRGNGTDQATIRALCDNGSQVNLITDRVLQKLNLRPTPSETNFVGVGGNSLGMATGEIWLPIQLRSGACMVSKFYVVKHITTYCPRSVENEWAHMKDELADPHYHQAGTIKALLGITIWIRIIESEVIKGNSTIAHKTKLGYVILGTESDPYNNERPYIGSITKGETFDNLSTIIQKLWEIEEVNTTTRRTPEAQLCEDVFVNQHGRTALGRYIVKLPFNSKLNQLGKTKRQALRQFFAMERKMQRNKEFGEKYRAFMTEYEALNHMEQVWDTEECGYYTPHHGIVSGKRFRVVFNASAQSTSGISLNDTQLIGEKLQQDLFMILINFRKFRFGLAADIEKMFRQILVHPDHRKYQKILWRSSEREAIRTYELRTVTYGHAAAPHCAIRALIQCACDHEQQYPNGARLVKECFYVDDLLTGADSLQEVDEIRDELTALLKCGGFPLANGKPTSTL